MGNAPANPGHVTQRSCPLEMRKKCRLLQIPDSGMTLSLDGLTEYAQECFNLKGRLITGNKILRRGKPSVE